MSLNIEVAGENALIVYFADQPSPETSEKILICQQLLKDALTDKLVDFVPSYVSLLVIFDPLQTDYFEIKRLLKSMSAQLSSTSLDSAAGKLIELPVYYDAEVGPELELIAQSAGISVEDVIDIHTATEYRVYAIGFAPGFAYLGEVDERIARARLTTPRLKVPKGAVAIADKQTAVYPSVSPGGWNLIGRCPTPMFDPENQPCMPVQSGDRVKFKAIDKQTFLSMGGEL